MTTRKNAHAGAEKDVGRIDRRTRKNGTLGAQKSARLMAWIDQRAACFRSQGSVVETWRTYQGRRLGPYYRLKFRQEGRQQSLYLGSYAKLADAVRQRLAELQRPRRESRALQRDRKVIRAELRRHQAALARQLALLGIHMKGWEFRGVRKLGVPRLPRTLPQMPALATPHLPALRLPRFPVQH